MQKANPTNQNVWTDEEIQFVVDNYSKMRKNDIAKALKRSRCTMYKHINRLRKEGKIPPLSKDRETALANRPKTNNSFVPDEFTGYSVELTQEQEDLIRKYHKTMKRTQLAKMVGIGKTELNFVLMSKGLGSKEN